MTFTRDDFFRDLAKVAVHVDRAQMVVPKRGPQIQQTELCPSCGDFAVLVERTGWCPTCSSLPEVL